MAAELERFCCRWHANRRDAETTVILVGDSGRGKSAAMRAATAWCRSHAIHAYQAGGWRRSAPQIAMDARWPEIVDGFKSGDYSPVQDLMELDLVALDDIGAEHDPSKNGTDKLCQILTRRENNWTLMTTNVPLEKWADRWDARVQNRMLRHTRIVDLSGAPSYAEWLADRF